MTRALQLSGGRRRLIKQLPKDFFAAFGVFAAVFSVLMPLFPDIPTKQRPATLLAAVLVCSVYPIFRAWPTVIQHTYHVDQTTTRTTIRVVKGNLFQSGNNLVIPMPNTFETAIDFVGPTSVHRSFQEEEYDWKIDELDRDLEASLSHVEGFAINSVQNRTNRKQKVYPIGTVAVIRRDSKRYFCLASTKFDDDPNSDAVVGSVDGLWESLSSLWRSVRGNANDEGVCVPLIGTGYMRMSHVLPNQDAIRLLVLSFLLASRQGRIAPQLDIVIREDVYATLDHRELQAFLDSLDES